MDLRAMRMLLVILLSQFVVSSLGLVTAEFQMGTDPIRRIRNQLCCGNLIIKYNTLISEPLMRITAETMREIEIIERKFSGGALLIRNTAQPSESPLVVLELFKGQVIDYVSAESSTKMEIDTVQNSPILAIETFKGAQVRVVGDLFPLDQEVSITAHDDSQVCVDGVRCENTGLCQTGDVRITVSDNANVFVGSGNYPRIRISGDGNSSADACGTATIQALVVQSGLARASVCTTAVLQADNLDGSQTFYNDECVGDNKLSVFAPHSQPVPQQGCTGNAPSACSISLAEDGSNVDFSCNETCAIPCFSSSSSVRTLQGEEVVTKRITDVQVGELVESFDDSGRRIFSEVFLVQHIQRPSYHEALKRIYYRREKQSTEDADSFFTASDSHYILKASQPKAEYATVSTVEEGGTIFVIDHKGEAVKAIVTSVQEVQSRITNIHTMNDRIVVDNVLASCVASVKIFGVVDSFHLRFMLWPLKALHLMGAGILLRHLDLWIHEAAKHVMR